MGLVLVLVVLYCWVCLVVFGLDEWLFGCLFLGFGWVLLVVWI